MEIQISSPTQAQPLPLVQWNYEEVKQYVEDGLARYKGVVYDDTQIALAKTDRANLNKLAAAIDAKRKEMKSLYLQPYTEFEAQAKELTAMIKRQSDEIDAQVKAFDNFRKEEKLAQIKEGLYVPMIGDLADLVPYERLHDPKWLNVTCSAATVSTEMARKIENIISGLKAIDQLSLAPDIAERVKSVFLRGFDLAAAIAEKDRILAEREKLERYKAAQQAQSAPVTANNPGGENTPPAEERHTAPVEQPAAEEKTYTVAFRIHVTKAQLDLLGAFMKSHGIKPERV
jgi:hypothetical protein